MLLIIVRNNEEKNLEKPQNCVDLKRHNTSKNEEDSYDFSFVNMN